MPEVQHNSRVRRTVNELVMAEMFLLQATIESANAIGEGITELGRQNRDEKGSRWQNVSSILQKTTGQALEPYSSRYRYFRDMRRPQG